MTKCLWMLFFSMFVSAHEGHHHDAAPTPTPPLSTGAQQKQTAAYESISERYMREVKPIFQGKCFDCHGGTTVYPWYHAIPGIKQWIDHDVADAKKHIDFSTGFPFKSHATPPEDLEAIRDELRKGDMPPLDYRLMHWGTSLSDEEKQIVYDWVEAGLKSLKEVK